MRYFIRSVKCLVLVAILFTIVVLAMFYLSEHDSSLRPWDLFSGNWKKIILFSVAYAAGYPLIGYSKRDLGIIKDHFELGAGKESFEWI